MVKEMPGWSVTAHASHLFFLVFPRFRPPHLRHHRIFYYDGFCARGYGRKKLSANNTLVDMTVSRATR